MNHASFLFLRTVVIELFVIELSLTTNQIILINNHAALQEASGDKMCKPVITEAAYADECELSLSLSISMPNSYHNGASAQRSNVSSTSEISEAAATSSYSIRSSISSHQLSLDLSMRSLD